MSQVSKTEMTRPQRNLGVRVIVGVVGVTVAVGAFVAWLNLGAKNPEFYNIRCVATYNGIPLEGARVTFLGDNGVFSAHRTMPQGDFVIRVRPGVYKVVFNKPADPRAEGNLQPDPNWTEPQRTHFLTEEFENWQTVLNEKRMLAGDEVEDVLPKHISSPVHSEIRCTVPDEGLSEPFVFSLSG